MGNLEGPVNGPAHPVLIVSAQDRVDRKQRVVVLMGTTLRPGQPFQTDALQITLDQEDGLNWQTRFDCDLLYTLEKKDITQRRGEVVSLERRRVISKRIV